MNYIFNKKNNSTAILPDEYFSDYMLLNELKHGEYVEFENEREMNNFVSRYREEEIKKAEEKEHGEKNLKEFFGL